LPSGEEEGERKGRQEINEVGLQAINADVCACMSPAWAALFAALRRRGGEGKCNGEHKIGGKVCRRKAVGKSNT